jgi:hypothetical protein
MTFWSEARNPQGFSSAKLDMNSKVRMWICSGGCEIDRIGLGIRIMKLFLMYDGAPRQGTKAENLTRPAHANFRFWSRGKLAATPGCGEKKRLFHSQLTTRN